MASADSTSVSIANLHPCATPYTDDPTQAPQARDRLSLLPPELLVRVLSYVGSLLELRDLLRACPACHYVYVENKRRILTQIITNAAIERYYKSSGLKFSPYYFNFEKSTESRNLVDDEVDLILERGGSFEKFYGLFHGKVHSLQEKLLKEYRYRRGMFRKGR